MISNNNGNCTQLSKKQENDNRNNDREVKYLDTPTQSKNDLKKYRAIELKNGLKALLISDIYDESNGDDCADPKSVGFLRNEIYKYAKLILTSIASFNKDNNASFEAKSSNIASNNGDAFHNEECKDTKEKLNIKSLHEKSHSKWNKLMESIKELLACIHIDITEIHESINSSNVKENEDDTSCHENHDEMEELEIKSTSEKLKKMAADGLPIFETGEHRDNDSANNGANILLGDNKVKEYMKILISFIRLYLDGVKIRNEKKDFKNESSSQDEDTSCNKDNDASNKLESEVLFKDVEKMAACALCIDVGNFSDPLEIQGLAHFLEHMVFMGSEKYPEEDGFDMFTLNCGGFADAFTSAEHTTFQFQIIDEQLFSALDRFVQFFIAPLLSHDAMAREREAIESEFQMEKSDLRRQDQLLSSLAKANHPVRKFACGNLKTLRDNIEDDKLYEKLQQFRERHYSAHRMTLAIQAQLPLDTLEDYVKKYFSSIPSNNLPAEDFSSYKDSNPFDTHSFRRIYKIKPDKDICKVKLTWAMTCLQHFYRVKPHEYIAWLIGDERKGSLISYLRKKMWCLDIQYSNTECDFENSSMYTLFGISLFLTQEGYTHLKQVLDTVFSFINLVCKSGLNSELYDYLRNGKDLHFRHIGEIAPIDYVTQLCQNMHYYTPIDYITGSHLYFEYDPVSIKNCMDILTPENVNIMILNKQFDKKTLDKTEIWFNTKYSDEEIPREWIDCWKKIEPFPEFHLRERKNHSGKHYGPLYFILMNGSNQHPQKIYEDDLYELWYKPDVIFRSPTCYMKFRLISSLFTLSPKEQAIGDLLVNILNHIFVEELFSGPQSNLNYDIVANENGLIIEISGFINILPLLFERIITLMAKCTELVTEDLFLLMKSELLKYYNNQMLNPVTLQESIKLSISVLSGWSTIERHNALRDVSFEDFQHFAKSYTEHVYIQGLIQGNMSQDDVIKNVSNTLKILNCGPLLENTLSQTKIISLPIGAYCCQLKNFNSSDSNSIVTNYYESDVRSVKLFVIIELLATILQAPLFNELRTHQQLGYEIFCLLNDTFGVLAFSITVCTQADKFSTDEVDSRIEKFLESFYSKLNAMSDKEFETIKKTLIKVKQCTHINLNEEVERNWVEILSGGFMFDRLKQHINELEKVNISHVRNWFKAHMLGGSNCKKLSIHIIGSKNKNNEQIECENSDSKSAKDCNDSKLSLEFIDNSANNECNSKLNYDGYITDIKKFQDKLDVYPLYGTDTQYNSEQRK